MSGIVRPHLNCGLIVVRRATRNFAHRFQHGKHVILRKERKRRLVLAVTLLVRVLRVFFHEVRCIGQEQIAKLDGGGVGEYLSADSRRAPAAAASPCGPDERA